jgi:peptidyl-prolyl cis-trans isomerase C
MERAVFLVAVLLLSIGFTPPLAAQTAPAKIIAEPVAAIIDGKNIYPSDVKLIYDSLPAQYREVPLATLYNQLLTRVINQKLIAAEALKSGLLADPDVKRRFAFLTEGALEQLYLDHHLKDALDRDRLRKEYKARIASQPKQEEVRARHILLKPKDKDKAIAIIAELKKGADFAKLAARKSTGPSARNGGDLGYFGRGQMVPEFSRVAFALKKGEFSAEPVRTQFGWHVILVEDRRIAGGKSFDEAYEEIRQAKSQAMIDGITKKLRAKADIKIIGTGKIQRVP